MPAANGPGGRQARTLTPRSRRTTTGRDEKRGYVRSYATTPQTPRPKTARPKRPAEDDDREDDERVLFETVSSV